MIVPALIWLLLPEPSEQSVTTIYAGMPPPGAPIKYDAVAAPFAEPDLDQVLVPTESAVPSQNTPATAVPVLPSTDQADIVVTARPGPAPIDPLAPINEASFKGTQAVDRALTRPAAMAYQRHVPSPIRSGLRNFFLNLHEIDVFLNFWLQLKPGKAMETAGRFAINSTIGVGGLFDVAKTKPFHLPRRRNGLADSLGFYGVGPGPFFYLPLIGATTLRDVFGNSVDGLVLPTLIGKPFTGTTYTLPSTVIRALDHRAQFDDTLSKVQADANPYNASRAEYLNRRQIEIDHLRGRDRDHKKPPAALVVPPLQPVF